MRFGELLASIDVSGEDVEPRRQYEQLACDWGVAYRADEEHLLECRFCWRERMKDGT